MCLGSIVCLVTCVTDDPRKQHREEVLDEKVLAGKLITAQSLRQRERWVRAALVQCWFLCKRTGMNSDFRAL